MWRELDEISFSAAEYDEIKYGGRALVLRLISNPVQAVHPGPRRSHLLYTVDTVAIGNFLESILNATDTT